MKIENRNQEGRFTRINLILPNGFLRCVDCGKLKNIEEFYRYSKTRKSLRSKCKSCFLIQCKKQPSYGKSHHFSKGNKCVDCGCLVDNRYSRCHECSRKFRQKESYGHRSIMKDYWYIKLNPDHKFYSMALQAHGHIGKIPEHRLKMAEKLGRILRTDEIVHHIDGNKLNNKLSNLKIMTASAHRSQTHKDIQLKIKRLENEIQSLKETVRLILTLNLISWKQERRSL